MVLRAVNGLNGVPGVVDASCEMDLRQFPFDQQNCSLRFESWSLNTESLYLVPMDQGTTQNAHVNFQEYNVTGLQLSQDMSEYNLISSKFSSLEMVIHARRLPHYYVSNAILPLLLLTTLSTLVAWLPVSSSLAGGGERLGFALTLLLTVFATMLFTAGKRPNLGHAMWLDQLQSLCILLTALPIMETCMVMWIHRHHDALLPRLLPYYRSLSMSDADIAARNCAVDMDVCFRHLYPVVVSSQIIYKANQVSDSYSVFWRAFSDDSQGWLVAVVSVAMLMRYVNFAGILLLKIWSCWLQSQRDTRDTLLRSQPSASEVHDGDVEGSSLGSAPSRLGRQSKDFCKCLPTLV